MTILFHAPYKKSLTVVFPRFLEVMAKYHNDDVQNYFRDAFSYEGSIHDSVQKMTALFTEIGIDMYFDGDVQEEKIKAIDIETSLTQDEIICIVKNV